MRPIRCIGILFAIIAVILLVAACGRRDTADPIESVDPTDCFQSTEQTYEPTATLAPMVEPSPVPPADPALSYTIMVYMVGSDLESRSGAATLDLEEIAESGFDTEVNRLFVYAGGTEFWHSEFASADKDTLLRFTSDGFETAEELPKRSMGEAETLAEFINYCVEESLTEHYALILWDHGRGPVMGFGKDTGFSGDALTLAEIRSALQKTPFSGGRKLDWVGLDACLMASAELACVLSDHADYLVASQETEPYFGWEYAFLGRVGRCGTEELLGSIAEGYLGACTDYYERKGYKGGEATLSVLDLSCAGRLHDAIEALFAAAEGNVDTDYNQLAIQRVNTRALGRTSTGSEFDLVDLRDMAERLKPDYRAEAAELIDAISEMVVVNRTNTELLCGLSIYYPFYNKSLYKNSWADEYRELDVFDEYLGYLERYAARWLSAETPEEYAESLTITRDGNLFSLQLTPEQQACFASARYYILESNGGDEYHMIYMSGNVSNDDGLLSARYDGKVICCADRYGKISIAPAVQRETVADKTYYILPVALSNRTDYGYGFVPADYEEKTGYAQYRLVLDNTTNKITIGSLDYSDGGSSVTDGKPGEVDTSEWTIIQLFELFRSIVRRYDNGTVRPLSDWSPSSIITWREMNLANGPEFCSVPLPIGEYSIVFEITDTCGNKYCSELLRFESAGEHFVPENVVPEPEPLTVNWSEGSQMTLFEQDGVCVKGVIENDRYGELRISLIYRNDTDRDLRFDGYDLTVNDIATGYGLPDETVLAHSSVTTDSLYFGTAEELGLVDSVETVGFALQVTDCRTYGTVVNRQRITIEFENDVYTPEFRPIRDDFLPYCGAFSEDRLLFENEYMRVTLVKFGAEGTIGVNPVIYYCVENLSEDKYCMAVLNGVALNGVTVYSNLAFAEDHVAPGMRAYFRKSTLYPQYCEMLEGVTDVRLLFTFEVCERFDRQGQVRTVSSERKWMSLPLSQSASAPTELPPGATRLYSKDGLYLSFWGEGQPEPFSASSYNQRVYIVIENNTGMDLGFRITDIALDGVTDPAQYSGYWYGVSISNGEVGDRQMSLATIFIDYKDGHGEATLYKTLSFRLIVMNFDKTAELWRSEELITVPAS